MKKKKSTKSGTFVFKYKNGAKEYLPTIYYCLFVFVAHVFKPVTE